MNSNNITDVELEYEQISLDYYDLKARIRQLQYPQSIQEQEIVYNSIYSIHSEIIELTIRCKLLDEKQNVQASQIQFSFTKTQIENLYNQCQTLKMVLEKIYKYYFKIPKHQNKLIKMYNYLLENTKSSQIQPNLFQTIIHETISEMQKKKNKLQILEGEIDLVTNLCPGCLEVSYQLQAILLQVELIINFFQRAFEQKDVLQDNNRIKRNLANRIFSEYLILPDNRDVIQFLNKNRQSQPKLSIQVITENELQQSNNQILQQIQQNPNFTVKLKQIPNPPWQEQKTIIDVSQSTKQRVNSQIFTDFKLPDDRKIQPYVQKSQDLSKSSVIKHIPSFEKSRFMENSFKRQ